MKTIAILALCTSVLSITGCAGLDDLDGSKKTLQIAELKSQLAATDKEVELNLNAISLTKWHAESSVGHLIAEGTYKHMLGQQDRIIELRAKRAGIASRLESLKVTVTPDTWIDDREAMYRKYHGQTTNGTFYLVNPETDAVAYPDELFRKEAQTGSPKSNSISRIKILSVTPSIKPKAMIPGVNGSPKSNSISDQLDADRARRRKGAKPDAIIQGLQKQFPGAKITEIK